MAMRIVRELECDICGLVSQDYPPRGPETGIPLMNFLLPVGWKTLDNQDICPKHAVKIEDK